MLTLTDAQVNSLAQFLYEEGVITPVLMTGKQSVVLALHNALKRIDVAVLPEEATEEINHYQKAVDLMASGRDYDLRKAQVHATLHLGQVRAGEVKAGPTPLNGKWVCGKCARWLERGFDDGQIPNHHRTCPQHADRAGESRG